VTDLPDVTAVEATLPDVTHAPIAGVHATPPVLARLLRERADGRTVSPFQSYLAEES
jgi:hypothetical protein